MMFFTPTSEPTPVATAAAGDPLPGFLADGQTAMRWLITGLCVDRRFRTGDAQAARCVRRLCAELSAHLHVEEELLFPRLRDVARDTAALDRAEVVRDLLRDQLHHIAEAGPDEPQFAARVQVLGDWLDRELVRERVQVHSQLPALAADGPALVRAMARRRDALLALAAAGHGPHFENEDADPVGRPPH